MNGCAYLQKVVEYGVELVHGHEESFHVGFSFRLCTPFRAHSTGFVSELQTAPHRLVKRRMTTAQNQKMTVRRIFEFVVIICSYCFQLAQSLLIQLKYSEHQLAYQPPARIIKGKR
jgi:hypothetical protein